MRLQPRMGGSQLHTGQVPERLQQQRDLRHRDKAVRVLPGLEWTHVLRAGVCAQLQQPWRLRRWRVRVRSRICGVKLREFHMYQRVFGAWGVQPGGDAVRLLPLVYGRGLFDPSLPFELYGSWVLRRWGLRL